MKISIIGHFGGEKKFNDGQTVKTKSLYEGFKNRGVYSYKVDTYYSKKQPIIFWSKLLKALIVSKKIIVLVSANGRRILFPILYLFSILGKDVYHYAIGGRLAREVEKNKTWKKYLISFRGNWMESQELTNNLIELGVENAIYLPNFKKLDILKIEDLNENIEEPFKFCIFSRVMKEKGVKDAIDTIVKVNNLYGKIIAKLDIYGPIESRFKQEFDELLIRSNETCRYCGIIDSDKSVNVLKEYYMLLFPTHWKHEGIPGTIIDALSSGLPIIARRWQYCDEMITNMETGLVYDFDKPEKIYDCICFAIEHKETIKGMRENCLKKAYFYSEEYVMDKIMENIESN